MYLLAKVLLILHNDYQYDVCVKKVKVKYTNSSYFLVYGFHNWHTVCWWQRFWIAGMTLEKKFKVKLKLFIEESYVSPTEESRQAWLPEFLSANLFSHNDSIYKEWLKSYQLVQGIACGKTTLLKFEIAKYRCDLENKANFFNLIKLVFVSKQCTYASLVKSHPLIPKLDLKKYRCL